jgi:hypothetical protein
VIGFKTVSPSGSKPVGKQSFFMPCTVDNSKKKKIILYISVGVGYNMNIKARISGEDRKVIR